VPRIARKAQNQALFREVNERIAEVGSGLDESEEREFICECAHLGCTALVPLAPAAYARVRDDPTTFLVLAGHEDTGHEEVIEDAGAYLIVRAKPGPAEEIARDTAAPTGAPTDSPAAPA
jgi:hypothetical protein